MRRRTTKEVDQALVEPFGPRADPNTPRAILRDEVLAQRAIIERVRALLTDGPGADTRGVPAMIQRADAEWREAIKKALGD
jgi:hypothetical protein